MQNNQTWFFIKLSIAFILFIYWLYKTIRALNRGKISYTLQRGNIFFPTTYTRKDSPVNFWGGIFLFSLLSILALVSAAIIYYLYFPIAI